LAFARTPIRSRHGEVPSCISVACEVGFPVRCRRSRLRSESREDRAAGLGSATACAVLRRET
jgi:hypothetical protein